MSVKRIRRVDPMQSAKVTAILTAALALLFLVPFMLIFSMAGLSEGGSSPFGAMMGGGIFMVILAPLLYAIFGFIAGLIYALAYNATYKLHGGLQLEYDDLDDDINRIGQ